MNKADAAIAIVESIEIEDPFTEGLSGIFGETHTSEIFPWN